MPLELAPARTAPDAEDFAVYMLKFVAMGQFELYIDCKSALRVLARGAGAGTNAAAPRPHLWGAFWGSFSPADFQAHKTLGHGTAADVEAGRTTEWGRRGNGKADELAKLGAAAHNTTIEDEYLWRGLSECAAENARWGTELAVSMGEGGLTDHHDVLMAHGGDGREARDAA